MDRKQRLAQELRRLDGLDRKVQLELDDEAAGEDTEMELELLDPELFFHYDAAAASKLITAITSVSSAR